MISVGTVEATSATAIHISFTAIGGGLSTTVISRSASQMTTSFQQEFVSRSLSYTISSVDGVTAAVAQAKTIDVEATLHFGAASAEEIVALDSFSEMIQVVFSQLFNIDISMISVGSVEATSATAIHISFSATGSGLSTTMISSSASQIKSSFQEEFVSRSLSYTISSVDGLIAVASEVSATANTCTSSKDCTDSATPMCSDSKCVEMSCGG